MYHERLAICRSASAERNRRSGVTTSMSFRGAGEQLRSANHVALPAQAEAEALPRVAHDIFRR